MSFTFRIYPAIDHTLTCTNSLVESAPAGRAGTPSRYWASSKRADGRPPWTSCLVDVVTDAPMRRCQLTMPAYAPCAHTKCLMNSVFPSARPLQDAQAAKEIHHQDRDMPETSPLAVFVE